MNIPTTDRNEEKIYVSKKRVENVSKANYPNAIEQRSHGKPGYAGTSSTLFLKNCALLQRKSSSIQ